MTTETDTIELATELTIAWLSNPNTRTSADDVPAFLQSMHNAVAALGGDVDAAPADAASVEYTPAVTARKSLASKDHIISMIDGKPYKTLRRHLTSNGLTPEEYRERYGLKKDYPMVAASYSENRREMAKKIGLGRRPGQSENAEAEATTPAGPNTPAEPSAPAEQATPKPRRKLKVATPTDAE